MSSERSSSALAEVTGRAAWRRETHASAAQQDRERQRHDPAHQRLVVHDKLDHRVQRQAHPGQQGPQRICLQGSREAVEDEPALARPLRNPLLDDADDHVVGNEIAALHDAAHHLAELPAGFDGAPQHVACG